MWYQDFKGGKRGGGRSCGEVLVGDVEALK
jgi:hypothetical protein